MTGPTPDEPAPYGPGHLAMLRALAATGLPFCGLHQALRSVAAAAARSTRSNSASSPAASAAAAPDAPRPRPRGGGGAVVLTEGVSS